MCMVILSSNLLPYETTFELPHGPSESSVCATLELGLQIKGRKSANRGKSTWTYLYCFQNKCLKPGCLPHLGARLVFSIGNIKSTSLNVSLGKRNWASKGQRSCLPQAQRPPRYFYGKNGTCLIYSFETMGSGVL